MTQEEIESLLKRLAESSLSLVVNPLPLCPWCDERRVTKIQRRGRIELTCDECNFGVGKTGGFQFQGEIEKLTYGGLERTQDHDIGLKSIPDPYFRYLCSQWQSEVEKKNTDLTCQTCGIPLFPPDPRRGITLEGAICFCGMECSSKYKGGEGGLIPVKGVLLEARPGKWMTVMPSGEAKASERREELKSSNRGYEFL